MFMLHQSSYQCKMVGDFTDQHHRSQDSCSSWLLWWSPETLCFTPPFKHVNNYLKYSKKAIIHPFLHWVVIKIYIQNIVTTISFLWKCLCNKNLNLFLAAIFSWNFEWKRRVMIWLHLSLLLTIHHLVTLATSPGSYKDHATSVSCKYTS